MRELREENKAENISVYKRKKIDIFDFPDFYCIFGNF